MQIHKSDMSSQEDHMLQSQELIASNQINQPKQKRQEKTTSSNPDQFITNIIQDTGITKYDERIYGKNRRNV